MIGVSLSSADSISMRTKSSGSSSRRFPRIVDRVEPNGTDNGEQDVALADFLAQDAAEIHAQRNRIHVEEHVLVTQRSGQPVADSPDDVATVVATVSNKNARIHRRLAWVVVDVKSLS